MLSLDTPVHERVDLLRRSIRRATCAVVRLREIPASGATIVVIDLIVVPDKKRRAGRGHMAMEMICQAADLYGWELELLVDSYWGTPEPVLRAFYYGFGFRAVCSPSRHICMVRSAPALITTELAPAALTPVSV